MQYKYTFNSFWLATYSRQIVASGEMWQNTNISLEQNTTHFVGELPRGWAGQWAWDWLARHRSLGFIAQVIVKYWWEQAGAGIPGIGMFPQASFPGEKSGELFSFPFLLKASPGKAT